MHQVKAKRQLGVPPKSFVSEAKATAKDKGLNEKHLLDTKRIRNIRTKFNIGFKEKKHTDDFMSLRIWINEFQKNSEEPLVMHADEHALHLKGMDTSQMALMSPLQKDLAEHSQEMVCIDSTHGTNSHKLQCNAHGAWKQQVRYSMCIPFKMPVRSNND